ncbi:MAG: hypothetical protein K0R26_855 [Bacteroidota bacterium]|nr:hypothetical protein [Bacteroidota bacterium]
MFLNAQEYPEKPTQYVTDEAKVLSTEQERILNWRLKAFEDSTTNQIFVYTALSLNGRAIENVSQDIFHKWHIGQGKKNNGVLIAVFINDHKFRIHTGYGLEGALPDLLTKHIQDKEMRPFFIENKYYEGIDKGIEELMYYSRNEFSPSDIEESPIGLFIFFYAFASVFLLVTLLLNRKMKDRPTAKKVVLILSILFFLIPFIGAFLLLIMVFIALSLRKDLVNSGSSGTATWTSSGESSSWSTSDYSSSGSSDFGGGGGGDSGGGGSSSDW